MPFDPYERAAARAAEQAAADRAAGREPGAAEGDRPPDALARASRNIGRKVLLGVVVLLGVMWIGSIRRPSPPQLAADCAKAAFKLSTGSIPQTKVVSFTIVGPAGRRFALAVDARTLAAGSDGRWQPVAAPGKESDVLLPAPDAPMAKACTRSGFFATPIAVGQHTVTLYEVTDSGVTVVAEQPLEITEPKPGFAVGETR